MASLVASITPTLLAFALLPLCATSFLAPHLLNPPIPPPLFSSLDDEPPSVDVSKFNPDAFTKPASSFSLTSRSAPSNRKSMGTSAGSRATVYVCTNCGSEHVKWLGKCPTCNEWGSIQEYSVKRDASKKSGGLNEFKSDSSSSSSSSSWMPNDDDYSVDTNRNPESFNVPVRMSTLISNKKNENKKVMQRLTLSDNSEFNTVLSGGLTPGSLTLLCGSPGVGKSTLLMQISKSVCRAAQDATSPSVLYVSGEESSSQIRDRALRLGFDADDMFDLLTSNDADDIADAVAYPVGEAGMGKKERPSLVIIDSIQVSERRAHRSECH